MGLRHHPDDLGVRDARWLKGLLGGLGGFARRYHRADVRGLDHLPDGPTLMVANHNGGPWSPDTWIVGEALLTRFGPDRVPYGLGHEVVVQFPVSNRLLMPLGVVRASPGNAHALFAQGSSVLVYPGGDEDAYRPWRRRNDIVFAGRTGYIKLALRARVPITPVVSAGAHNTFLVVDDLKWLARALGITRLTRLKVMPLTLCLPWGVTLGLWPYLPLPARITSEILSPIYFDHLGPEAAEDPHAVAECARVVEAAMQTALDRLAAEP